MVGLRRLFRVKEIGISGRSLVGKVIVNRNHNHCGLLMDYRILNWWSYASKIDDCERDRRTVGAV